LSCYNSPFTPPGLLIILISTAKKPKKPSRLKTREVEATSSLLEETLHKLQFGYSRFREKRDEMVD